MISNLVFKRASLIAGAVIIAACYSNCSPSLKGESLENASSTLQSNNCGSDAPTNVPANPRTIDEALELMNQLPKPLTIACFLSALPKPLQIYAVDNVFSAQPSAGPESPRIFVINGNLLISVVPAGPGRDVIEFSEVVGILRSVKAEIPFPVTRELSASEPYSRILDSRSGTSCQLCHGSEIRHLPITTGEAYVSKIVLPNPIQRVPQRDLKSISDHCNWSLDPERCQILKTIFIDGKAADAGFPSGPSN
jgi:hypothetical protein